MGWYNAAWTRRKKITVDNTKVAGTSHSDFPVLVSVTDADIKASAQADGDDILFTSSDGMTKLDHEIEEWDSGTGVLVAWVRVPTLSGSVDTDIYVYYGNATATSQENAAAVWDDNYKAVWHLNDDLEDSTANNNDLTNSGSDNATGKIADGQECIEENDDYMSDSDFAGMDGTSWEIVAWWKDNSGTSDIRRWITTTLAGVGGTDILFREENNQIRLYAVGGGAVTAATWKGSFSRFRLVGDGVNVKVFQDGNTTPIISFAAAATPATGIYVGGYYNVGPDEFADGVFDEIRISNSSRSDDWSTTEWNNQNSPGTFYSVAAEESFGVGWYDASWIQRKKITVDNTKVTGTWHIDFPVLVSITDADIKAAAQADGDDILFTSPDGTTKLDHEIEHWDSATGDLVAWVRIPTLPGAIDTEIYVYYGNPGAASQENPTGVWAAWATVHHSNESSGNWLDSTGVHDGTFQGDLPTQATGKIYKSQSADGTGDYITMPDHADWPSGSGDFSILKWIYADSADGKGVFEHQTDNNNSHYCYMASPSKKLYWSLLSGGSFDWEFTSDAGFPEGSWVQAVLVRQGSSQKMYINKVLQTATGSFAGSMADHTGVFNVGYVPRQSQYLQGDLDEFRIIKGVALSGDWIATEYDNQNSPGTFLSVGAEEGRPTTLNRVSGVLDRTASGVLVRVTA